MKKTETKKETEKTYYKAIRPIIECKEAKGLEEPERVDKISYTPIGKQIEQFIASGQIVTSLKKMTAEIEENRKKTLEEVLEEPMTEFTKSIYEMDRAEAYQAMLRFDAKMKKHEMTEKEAQERIEAIKKRLEAIQKKEEAAT